MYDKQSRWSELRRPNTKIIAQIKVESDLKNLIQCANINDIIPNIIADGKWLIDN